MTEKKWSAKRRKTGEKSKKRDKRVWWDSRRLKTQSAQIKKGVYLLMHQRKRRVKQVQSSLFHLWVNNCLCSLQSRRTCTQILIRAAIISAASPRQRYCHPRTIAEWHQFRDMGVIILYKPTTRWQQGITRDHHTLPSSLFPLTLLFSALSSAIVLLLLQLLLFMAPSFPPLLIYFLQQCQDRRAQSLTHSAISCEAGEHSNWL